MENKYPEFLYKYRDLNPLIEIDKNLSVQALLNNQAFFSSRLNFNDIFDSQITLVRFTPTQLKALRNRLTSEGQAFVKECIAKGKFTPEGKVIIAELENTFKDLIDSYCFYCVSATPNSNLMWSHYASSHKGFCIEFRSKYLPAEKVEYSKILPEISVLQFFELHHNPNFNGPEFGQYIWKALRTKLEEWHYEQEYRIKADNNMGGKLPKGQLTKGFVYPEHMVESVILGYRMNETAKQFLAENLPKSIQIKQAKPSNYGIKVIASEKYGRKFRSTEQAARSI